MMGRRKTVILFATNIPVVEENEQLVKRLHRAAGEPTWTGRDDARTVRRYSYRYESMQ
jgi:hypothetical protein